MLRLGIPLCALVSGCSAQPPYTPTTTPREVPKATKHPESAVPCSGDGLTVSNGEERNLVANMVRRCEPIDHCLLECLRGDCANKIGGGCFHACSGRGIRPEQRDAVWFTQAAEFRLGTHELCHPPYRR